MYLSSCRSVVYKEQVRLNQAAASALMARLEAQKAICDSAERELHVKHKQRDELEKQIRPEWEQARKRSRTTDTLLEEDDDDKITLCLQDNELNMQQEMDENEAICAETAMNTLLLCLPNIKSAAHSHKELRKFLEEEQRASTASPLPNEEREEEEEEELEGGKETTKIKILKPDLEKTKDSLAGEDEYIVEERLEKLEIEDGGKVYDMQFPFPNETEEEEDDESRRRRGKGNIEKWMQFLLENTQEDADVNTQISDGKGTSKTDELIEKLNMIYPHTDIKDSRARKSLCTETVDGNLFAPDIGDENSEGDKENDRSMANVNTPFKNPPYRVEPQKTTAKESASPGKGAGRVSSPDEKVRGEKIGKERGLARSESARAFRRIPSSPSLILEGMKKRVDCIRRKPLVLDDNDADESIAARKSFMKSSIKTIKKAVRI